MSHMFQKYMYVRWLRYLSDLWITHIEQICKERCISKICTMNTLDIKNPPKFLQSNALKHILLVEVFGGSEMSTEIAEASNWSHQKPSLEAIHENTKTQETVWKQQEFSIDIFQFGISGNAGLPISWNWVTISWNWVTFTGKLLWLWFWDNPKNIMQKAISTDLLYSPVVF